jgi:pyruvate/2-oxoglutarate/acetoin dehydrogenase E1 component
VGYDAAVRTALQEIAGEHPELILLQAGGGDEMLPGAVHYHAQGCVAVTRAALGLALAGRRPIVMLHPPAAALAALQCFLPDLPEGPVSWIARILLDGWSPELGQFAALANWRIAAPATPADAQALLQRAFKEGGAWLFIEDRRLHPCREKAPHPATGRRGAICRQAGSEVTLVAAGAMLVAAVRAARVLAGKGIEAEVIDLRLLAPLDLETIRRSLQRTHRALVIDEGETPLGPTVAAAVTEAAFDDLDAPIGVVRVPSGTATLAEALDRAVPAVVTQACWLLGRSAGIASGG